MLCPTNHCEVNHLPICEWRPLSSLCSSYEWDRISIYMCDLIIELNPVLQVVVTLWHVEAVDLELLVRSFHCNQIQLPDL